MFDLVKESSELVAHANLDWERVRGKIVLVTGATGLIGSHCVRFLLEANKSLGLGTTVIALVRDPEKARDMLPEYGAQDGLELMVSDLLDVDPNSITTDFIIHAACPTASRFFIEHPVDTAKSIVDGTLLMLEAARINNASMVYVSSMEVYGNGNSSAGIEKALTEDQVGYVDPIQVRSCYPEAKRMAEHFCAAYASQYGTRACIVRLAQTFGPGIPKTDTRVFAQFARSAMEGSNIVLKTTGASTRMYSYTTDAVLALFTALLEGTPGSAYNCANPETYSSVKEMAELVCNCFSDGKSNVVVDVDPNAPYPPEHHIPLNIEALKSIGWTPQVGLEEMFARLIQYLED